MRMYFAAVAPPNPPPITTTRPFGAVVAQPAADSVAPAAASFRKSRRLNSVIAASLALLRREPARQLVDLLVAVTLGDLVHHGRRALAVAERPHLGCNVVLRHSGQWNRVFCSGASVGT